jgi:hypothetical protein
MWDGKFIKKENYPGWEKLQQIVGAGKRICSHCKKEKFTQMHHYFPQAIARDVGENPDTWPVEYLCDDCHKLWTKYVTPDLVDKNWQAAKNGAF